MKEEESLWHGSPLLGDKYDIFNMMGIAKNVMNLQGGANLWC